MLIFASTLLLLAVSTISASPLMVAFFLVMPILNPGSKKVVWNIMVYFEFLFRVRSLYLVNSSSNLGSNLFFLSAIQLLAQLSPRPGSF